MLVMIQQTIPVLRASSSEQAERFYCEQLGFQKRFAYRIDDTQPDPCYMGLWKDDAWIHVSSFPGDGQFGSAVYITVENVDDVHAELQRNGVKVDLEPTDQSWGNRETYVEDPDGNSVRFVQESAS